MPPRIPRRQDPAAVHIVRVGGDAVAGVWLAHLMFGLPILEVSAIARGTIGEFVGEIVATFGLVGLILSGSGMRQHRCLRCGRLHRRRILARTR